MLPILSKCLKAHETEMYVLLSISAFSVRSLEKKTTHVLVKLVLIPLLLLENIRVLAHVLVIARLL